MLRVTGAFFDHPVEEKMRYFVDDRSANRQYAPEGSEALAYSLGETERTKIDRLDADEATVSQ